ncbi:hypothetical protein [Nocardioides litoris]|uniref:hypothetical protein n=1 Tax=Nocardioides litoris TaxID=1926648 RepID=UPI00111EF5C9|nr:hypothetical protein [Nocardioides litoris]
MSTPLPGAAHPPPSYDDRRTPVVPTSVTVAVWSFRIAALYAVGSAAAFLLWVRGTLGDADKAASAADFINDRGLEGRSAEVVRRVADAASDERWRTVLTVVGVVFLVLALLAGVVYLLLARALRRGRGWARVVATVLAVVSLLWLVLGPQAWLWVAIGVVGVVASWRPSASAYLDACRADRLRVRQGRP